MTKRRAHAEEGQAQGAESVPLRVGAPFVVRADEPRPSLRALIDEARYAQARQDGTHVQLLIEEGS